MESYRCFTVQNVWIFSVHATAVFFMEGPSTEIYSHFNCLFVLVMLGFCISCLLVVVYGGLEEGQ